MKIVIAVLSLAALVYKVHSQGVELINTNVQFSSIYPNPEVSISYPPLYKPSPYTISLPPTVEIVQKNIDVGTSEPTINLPVEISLNPFPFLPRPVSTPSLPIPSVAVPSLPITSVAIQSLPIPSVAVPSLPIPSVAVPSLPIPIPVVTPPPAVYQKVGDNQLANSLANVLQMLVASKTIESSLKPNCKCVKEVLPIGSVFSPPVEIVTPIPSSVEPIIAPLSPSFCIKEVINQIPLPNVCQKEYVSVQGGTVVTSVDRVQPLYTSVSEYLVPGNVYLTPSVPTLRFPFSSVN